MLQRNLQYIAGTAMHTYTLKLQCTTTLGQAGKVAVQQFLGGLAAHPIQVYVAMYVASNRYTNCADVVLSCIYATLRYFVLEQCIDGDTTELGAQLVNHLLIHGRRKAWS